MSVHLLCGLWTETYQDSPTSPPPQQLLCNSLSIDWCQALCQAPTYRLLFHPHNNLLRYIWCSYHSWHLHNFKLVKFPRLHNWKVAEPTFTVTGLRYPTGAFPAISPFPEMKLSQGAFSGFLWLKAAPCKIMGSSHLIARVFTLEKWTLERFTGRHVLLEVSRLCDQTENCKPHWVQFF